MYNAIKNHQWDMQRQANMTVIHNYSRFWSKERSFHTQSGPCFIWMNHCLNRHLVIKAAKGRILFCTVVLQYLSLFFNKVIRERRLSFFHCCLFSYNWKWACCETCYLALNEKFRIIWWFVPITMFSVGFEQSWGHLRSLDTFKCVWKGQIIFVKSMIFMCHSL